MSFINQVADDHIFQIQGNHQSENPELPAFSAEIIQYNYQKKEHNRIPVNHRAQYEVYFKPVEDKANQRIQQSNKSSEEIIKHKIVLMNNQNNMTKLSNFKYPRIHILGSQYHGMVINYEIFLGNFKITLQMLNKNVKAPRNLDYRGQGGYGTVYNIKLDGNKNIVCKRSYFKKKVLSNHIKQINKEQYPEYQIQPNKFEIEELINQYGFYKICSFYKIGPSVVNCLGFDLVCFSDSIEFYMEECYRCRFIQTLQTDLKLCLRILHKINIIHKDIKPANILYSNTHKSYIFTDFGISHPVQQKPGQFSKTFKQGTQGYFCSEMNNLSIDKWGYVDLYFNDTFGLMTSIKEMNRYFSKQKYLQKSQDKNKTINKQYANIKLLYMILNDQQSQIINFIKHCNLYKEFFYDLDYLKYFHAKYNYLAAYLIGQNHQLIQLITQLKKIEKNNQFFQNRLNNQQIQLFVRVYGMTDQLIVELDKYDSNWRIENIKQQIKNKIIHKINLQTLNQKNFIQEDLRYMRYLEKQLQAMEWEQLQGKNIDQTLKINIYLRIFYLKIRYSEYYSSQISNLQQLLQHYLPKFSLIQKIQYQFNKILAQIIENKGRNDCHHRQVLRQLLKSNPKQALIGYRYYFIVIENLYDSTQLIQQYNLFYQVYGNFNVYCHIQQFIQMSIYIVGTRVKVGLLTQFEIFQQRLENFLIKNYNQKHYLCIDFLILKAIYFFKSYKIFKTVQTLRKVKQLIKVTFGQNNRLLICNLYLGICYFNLYEYQKSEILILETSQKIKKNYGECNTQYFKCLQILIDLEIKKSNLIKIKVYYQKLPKKLNKIQFDLEHINFDTFIKLLKFYLQNNLTEQANKFMLHFEEAYPNPYLDRSLLYYNLLNLKRQYYRYKAQNQKVEKILKDLKNIIHQSYEQNIKIKILREVAQHYLHKLEHSNRTQAQEIYQYIISKTKPLDFFHIESIIGLGKISYYNKNIVKAYDYFKQSYDLFKKSQIEYLDIQIKLTHQLGRCLLDMQRPLEALGLYLQILVKLQKIKKRVEGKLFVKQKIAQINMNIRKFKQAKKLYVLILKQIYKQNSKIDQVFSQYRGRKKYISSEKLQIIQIYESCLKNLYIISKKLDSLRQAIYYFQKIKTVMKRPVFDLQSNVYLDYYKQYACKKQLAYKYFTQQIKSSQYSKCSIHYKWITFFMITKMKINVAILLTLLIEVIRHPCQQSMVYYSFYMKNFQETAFKRCRSVLKSSKLTKNLSKYWSQSLQKIAIYKKMQFLNRKLSLMYSVIPHQVRYNI